MDDEALFDDDLTTLPAEAVAACATALWPQPMRQPKKNAIWVSLFANPKSTFWIARLSGQRDIVAL